MAKLKPRAQIGLTRTLNFEEDGIKGEAILRLVDAREWYDSDESKDVRWHPVPGKNPGELVVVRLRVTLA